MELPLFFTVGPALRANKAYLYSKKYLCKKSDSMQYICARSPTQCSIFVQEVRLNAEYIFEQGVRLNAVYSGRQKYIPRRNYILF